jgi:serine/threonine protein kinase
VSEGFLQLIEQRSDIDGRFTDIRRIGADGGGGNFSLMFTAYDKQTGQRVAIKVFNPTKADPYRIACFEREVEVLQQLDGQSDIIGWVAPRSTFTEIVHSGSIQIPFAFSYYPVELAVESVAGILARDGWNAEQKLLGFRAMCRAVQRIHQSGLVHRDLKPDNFLVMPDGSVRASDFGTARELNEPSLQSYGAPPGDMRYTAPELIALLHDVDPRWATMADIYGLGAILFELFSGTILGLQLFTRQLLNDLMLHMAAIPRLNRKMIYDGTIPHLATAHPLPSVTAFGAVVPRSIASRLDALYQSLAALDYRQRLTNFTSIFRQIDICLIIVRNEVAYNRWLQEKRRRRVVRLTQAGIVQGGHP